MLIDLLKAIQPGSRASTRTLGSDFWARAALHIGCPRARVFHCSVTENIVFSQRQAGGLKQPCEALGIAPVTQPVLDKG